MGNGLKYSATTEMKLVRLSVVPEGEAVCWPHTLLQVPHRNTGQDLGKFPPDIYTIYWLVNSVIL